MFYTGDPSLIRNALAVNDSVVVMKDSVTIEGKYEIDVTTLFQDTISKAWMARTKTNPSQTLAFVADRANPGKLALNGGLPLAAHTQSGPGPGVGPSVYNGPDTTVKNALSSSANHVFLLTGPNTPPVNVLVDPASLHFDGKMFLVQDAQDALKVYVFLSNPANPGQLQLDPTGVFPNVVPQTALAGL
jgi:hypothetical protein